MARPAHRRLKILLFNPSYPPVACGVGEYTRRLAGALTQAGHEVTVVTAATATDPVDGPQQVLPLLPEWRVRAFIRAWPRLRRQRTDLVVSGFPAVVQGRRASLLYLLPILAKVLLRRPQTTFIVHEFVRVGERDRRLMGLALRAADRVVAVTEAEREEMIGRFPSLAGRTVVADNAPNIPAVPEHPRADARARAALGPPDRRVIAFFGLISSPSKGVEDLLEALVRTDALLVASGSLNPEDDYHARVAGLIERLGLGQRVRWLGFLGDEEVGRMLRLVDAVVLPYQGGAESGYTSLLAALVNGAAVVTTRGPRNPSWLRDGENAVLVDPADADALVGGIERVLADERLAERVRAGARRLSFGWEKIAATVTGEQPISSQPDERQ